MGASPHELAEQVLYQENATGWLTFSDSESFLNDLEREWDNKLEDCPETANALLMELKAFPLAVEVAEATKKPGSKFKGWLKKVKKQLLPKTSIVLGSVKDILIDLSPLAKNGITLFKELVDIFKGRN